MRVARQWNVPVCDEPEVKHPAPLTKTCIVAVPCAFVGESNLPLKEPLAAPLQDPVMLGDENRPPLMGDVVWALIELKPEPEQD